MPRQPRCEIAAGAVVSPRDGSIATSPPLGVCERGDHFAAGAAVGREHTQRSGPDPSQRTPTRCDPRWSRTREDSGVWHS